MEFNLKKILVALLLSTSDSLSIKDIQGVFTRFHTEAEKWLDDEPEADDSSVTDPGNGQQVMRDLIRQVPSLLTATQIREAMEEIAAEAMEQGEVWRLLQGPAGYRIAVAGEYSEWVRLLRNDPKPLRLSQPALETLAVVAYRQPVTRAEIETIRGVSADSALSRLQELELVVVLGRADLPGRPIQYGTTDKFLEFIGVRSLEELPASDVLTPTQINEWIRRATEPQPVPDDSAMGLADQTEDRQAELLINGTEQETKTVKENAADES